MEIINENKNKSLRTECLDGHISLNSFFPDCLRHRYKRKWIPIDSPQKKLCLRLGNFV